MIGVYSRAACWNSSIFFLYIINPPVISKTINQSSTKNIAWSYLSPLKAHIWFGRVYFVRYHKFWLYFFTVSYCFVLLLFRRPQSPLRKTPREQEVGGAETQAKTPMRSGASSWSETEPRPLAAGRRGKFGSSLWRRSLMTSTPPTDNCRCSLPPPLSFCYSNSSFICLSHVLLCINVSVFVCFACLRLSVYQHVLLVEACVRRLFPSVVMKSLKPIKKSCRVTAAVCEPFTSICPCQ